MSTTGWVVSVHLLLRPRSLYATKSFLLLALAEMSNLPAVDALHYLTPSLLWQASHLPHSPSFLLVVSAARNSADSHPGTGTGGPHRLSPFLEPSLFLPFQLFTITISTILPKSSHLGLARAFLKLCRCMVFFTLADWSTMSRASCSRSSNT